jgi:hypothetical protein
MVIAPLDAVGGRGTTMRDGPVSCNVTSYRGCTRFDLWGPDRSEDSEFVEEDQQTRASLGPIGRQHVRTT